MLTDSSFPCHHSATSFPRCYDPCVVLCLWWGRAVGGAIYLLVNTEHSVCCVSDQTLLLFSLLSGNDSLCCVLVRPILHCTMLPYTYLWACCWVFSYMTSSVVCLVTYGSRVCYLVISCCDNCRRLVSSNHFVWLCAEINDHFPLDEWFGRRFGTCCRLLRVDKKAFSFTDSCGGGHFSLGCCLLGIVSSLNISHHDWLITCVP